VLNEDSHPHEAGPGAAARFFVPNVAERRKLDVKCVLSGPAGPVRMEFKGIQPMGRALAHGEFIVGRKE